LSKIHEHVIYLLKEILKGCDGVAVRYVINSAVKVVKIVLEFQSLKLAVAIS